MKCACTHLTDFQGGSAIKLQVASLQQMLNISAADIFVKLRMLTGIILGLFGLMLLSAGLLYPVDMSVRKQMLANLKKRDYGFRSFGGAWTWSLYQQPLSDAVDRATGTAVNVAGIVGVPFVRLRAAIPEELMRGSVALALGRQEKALSVKGVEELNYLIVDKKRAISEGIQGKPGRSLSSPMVRDGAAERNKAPPCFPFLLSARLSPRPLRPDDAAASFLARRARARGTSASGQRAASAPPPPRGAQHLPPAPLLYLFAPPSCSALTTHSHRGPRYEASRGPPSKFGRSVTMGGPVGGPRDPSRRPLAAPSAGASFRALAAASASPKAPQSARSAGPLGWRSKSSRGPMDPSTRPARPEHPEPGAPSAAAANPAAAKRPSKRSLDIAPEVRRKLQQQQQQAGRALPPFQPLYRGAEQEEEEDRAPRPSHTTGHLRRLEPGLGVDSGDGGGGGGAPSAPPATHLRVRVGPGALEPADDTSPPGSTPATATPGTATSRRGKSALKASSRIAMTPVSPPNRGSLDEPPLSPGVAASPGKHASFLAPQGADDGGASFTQPRRGGSSLASQLHDPSARGAARADPSSGGSPRKKLPARQRSTQSVMPEGEASVRGRDRAAAAESAGEGNSPLGSRAGGSVLSRVRACPPRPTTLSLTARTDSPPCPASA